VLDANLNLSGAAQTITTNAATLTLAGGTIHNNSAAPMRWPDWPLTPATYPRGHEQQRLNYRSQFQQHRHADYQQRDSSRQAI